ncbi:MAG: peptidoglycan DD-metalloendopeptidase family protein, partial [Muribaculaceae bacterium]|nr:peptidoglycan DD-metalloendopeptidase family protein [Muribaculaceae bacterium]
NILYRYNPETDNFERYYPSLKTRMGMWGKVGGIALLLAAAVFFLVFYCFDSPTERNLREENRQLRNQYKILNRRLDNSMNVLNHLRSRDDNFYRVMVQMDPMSATQRMGGLDNEARYRELERLSDADLVTQLNRRIDLMERQIASQVQSFDQLRQAIGEQKMKLTRIPSIIPLDMKGHTIASGYGKRRDPISGIARFHEGIDIAAPTGTPVFATGDGKVSLAERQAGYGNCVEIDHDFNYLSRYAHLSEILVKPGEEIKRGQVIGKVGSTGSATAPHLHYEVRFKGEAQNPVNYYFMELGPEEYSSMIQTAENAGHMLD